MRPDYMHVYWDDDAEEEVCFACHGEGFYHDCGDDTCCCLNPDEDFVFTCDECGGKGSLS